MGDNIKVRNIRLDASTFCQLKCPSCETAQGKIYKHLGGGFLEFKNFQKLVDDNPQISHIELSNWGEIFLNPNLLNIIKYAYSKNVALTATNGVNLNTVKQEVLEALVKYKFRRITCSIDGASQETYSIYRRGGNFKQVIENIKKINYYKNLYKSFFPILSWQFVIFGHNEHEVEVAQQLAKSLNMEFFSKLSWDEDISPVKDKDLVKKITNLQVSSRSEYLEKYGIPYQGTSKCIQLWHQPQINWDGKILGCCFNYWGDFGNAFTSNLSDVIHNEKMSYARQMLLGKAEAKNGIPCTTCGIHQNMKNQNQWLTTNQIDTALTLSQRCFYASGRLGVWIINRFAFVSLFFKILADKPHIK